MGQFEMEKSLKDNASLVSSWRNDLRRVFVAWNMAVLGIVSGAIAFSLFARARSHGWAGLIDTALGVLLAIGAFVAVRFALRQ